MNNNGNQLKQVAYIFNIITTVICGLLILPLAWMVPMTIHSKKIIDSTSGHIPFGVCSLFFLNPISGILSLISELK